MKKILLITFLTILSFLLIACKNAILDPKEDELKNDQIEPVLGIAADYESVTVKQGTTIDIYEGIHAIDNLEGDISDRIQAISGDFDINTPGVYEIVFFVLDTANNQSNFVSKTIIVSEVFEMLKRYDVFTGIIANEAPAPTPPACFKERIIIKSSHLAIIG